MKNRKLIKLFAVLLLATSASTAHALSISLTPASSTIGIGQQVSFDVVADFTGDPTLGGGMNFTWDSAGVSFVSYVQATNPALDPGFGRNPDISSGLANGAAFGNFAGITGPLTVATITFEALTAGIYAISTSANVLPAGPFVSASTFQAQDVDFSGATIEVTAPSQVPGPATLSLLLVGLAGFVSRKRLSR